MQSTNAPAPDSGGIIAPSTKSQDQKGGRAGQVRTIYVHILTSGGGAVESERRHIVRGGTATTPATPPARGGRRLQRARPDLPGLPTPAAPTAVPPVLPPHPRPGAPGPLPGTRYPLVVLDVLRV